MNFYTLDTMGYKALNGSARGFKRRHIPTSTNLLHHYIINIFHTGLQLQTEFEATTLTEKEILKENSFYNHFLENFDKSKPVSFAIPDFAMIIKGETKSHLFLGEVDTSTENISSQKQFSKTIHHKFESFNYYFENQIYKYFEDRYNTSINGFTYLHVTTGKKERVATISHTCKNLNPTMPILITTASKIYPRINYNKNRTATVDYSPLLEAKWFHVNKGILKTLSEVVV